MRIFIQLWLLGWLSVSGLALAQVPVNQFVQDLQSPLASVRRHAAVTLGESTDRAATDALIVVLGDSEPSVRREVAKSLGLIKDARAADALILALSDPDPNVRFYAAYALGELRSPKAVDALCHAMGDGQWSVRDQAAWALRAIGDAKIMPQLITMLQQDNTDTRHIIWLLQRLQHPDTSKQLIALLKASDPRVRLRAIVAIRELDDPLRVSGLIAALVDLDPRVRRAAIRSLEKIRDARAIKPLQQLLANESDAGARQLAESALRQLTRRQDLAAHWSFDHDTGQVVRDVTGRDNDGQLHGCRHVRGRVGLGLRFSDKGYIELGQPPDLDIGKTPLTVMAWIRSETPNGVVIAKGGKFCGFSLYVKDGVARFGIHLTKEGPSYIVSGRDQVTERWVHVAGVIQNDRIELFVDGELVATTPTKGFLPGNCGQDMEIGFDVANSPAEITDHFNGIIDEVKVYQAALTGTEIMQPVCEAPKATKDPSK